MSESFRTEIRSQDVSISGLDLPQLQGLESGSDYEIEPRAFFVSWDFQIEVRDWGVKEMSWYVTDIEGQIEIVLFDASGDEKETQVIDFAFDQFGRKADMDVPLYERQISPSEIAINYADCTVSVA